MTLWDLNSLEEALGERIIKIDADREFFIDSVMFDNRRLTPNGMFVARKGENGDGHDFIAGTLEKYPDITVLASGYPEGFENDSRIIIVDDTMEAMEAMAAYARRRINGRVIAITGSIGKTSTKEMMFRALSSQGRVHTNIQSFNTLIGVVTTLCNMPRDTEYAVLEMGMSLPGEIETLTKLAIPDIAVVLNIRAAHILNFKNETEIALAKSEIFSGLSAAGFAVINSDDRYFDLLTNEALKFTKNIKTFAVEKNADVRLVSANLDSGGVYNAEYSVGDKTYGASFRSHDYNIVQNFLPVLAVGDILNLDQHKSISAAEVFEAPRGRNNVEEITLRDGGIRKHITLINGSYNAVNPAAFESGLELMDSMARSGKYSRKVCIFGDILEAGHRSDDFHIGLKEPLERAGVDLLITVGVHMERLQNAVAEKIRGGHFATYEALLPLIKNFLRDGDLVFIKSSKGIKIWKIVDELTGYPTDIFV